MAGVDPLASQIPLLDSLVFFPIIFSLDDNYDFFSPDSLSWSNCVCVSIFMVPEQKEGKVL